MDVEGNWVSCGKTRGETFVGNVGWQLATEPISERISFAVFFRLTDVALFS